MCRQTSAVNYDWFVFLYYRDAIVGQVLDELGLQMADELSGLPNAGTTVKAGPSKQPQAAAAAAGGPGDADADLEARLENLRRQ